MGCFTETDSGKNFYQKDSTTYQSSLCILHNFFIKNNDNKLEKHTVNDLLQIATEPGNVGIENKPKSK